jgi:hypothetical protein
MKPTNQMKPKFKMVFFYRSRDGAQLYLKRLPQRRLDLFRFTSDVQAIRDRRLPGISGMPPFPDWLGR